MMYMVQIGEIDVQIKKNNYANFILRIACIYHMAYLMQVKLTAKFYSPVTRHFLDPCFFFFFFFFGGGGGGGGAKSFFMQSP